MKKLLMFMLVALVSVFVVNAQPKMYYDDCESYRTFSVDPVDSTRDWNWTFYSDTNNYQGFFPIIGYEYPNQNYYYQTMIVFNPDSTTPPLESTYATPYGDGTQYLMFQVKGMCNAAGTSCWQSANDWIISPELSGNYEVEFSFYGRGFQSGDATQEKFRVLSSTTDNAPTSFVNHPSTTPHYEVTQSDWKLYTYRFPIGTKYVALCHVSDNGFWFFMDEITVREIARYDLEAYAMGVPDYSCALTNQEILQIGVTNVGTDTVRNFSVSYQIGDNAPVTEVATIAFLEPNGEYIHNFTTPADLTFGMDDYDIRGWATVNGADPSVIDAFNANDTTDWYGTGVPDPQTVPSYTDFTNEEEYKGWTTFDANGDEGNYPYTWQHVLYEDNPMWRYIGDADDGEGHIGQNANDWLFTSCYDLEPGTYTFKFNYAGYDYAYTESFKLYWGEEPTVAGMTNHIADYNNVINTVFARASHNITITEAGIYYFGFKATSLANNAYLFIDEVSLDVAAEQELTILEVNAPEISCTLTGEETISIVIRNDGTEPVTTFEAEYTIGNTPAVTETATDVNIAPGATYTYTFTTPADLTIPAIDTLYAAVMVGEDNVDVFPENVLVGSAFSVTTYPDTNKFSDDYDNIGWVSIDDKMDGNRWRPILFNNDKCWINEGFNVLAQIPAEESHDWLLSSCYDLEAGEYTVKFDYCIYNPSYTADLKLYYGTEREINMTNQIWGNSQIGNTEYNTSSTVLEIPTAGTYYFGFLAFAQQYLFLDNFVILKGEEEEPVDPTSINDVANNSADITLYPNPANSYIQLNSNETMSQVTIFDMFGKQITTEEVNATTANISVANLSVGMYMAKIYTENGVTVKKFSKM